MATILAAGQATADALGVKSPASFVGNTEATARRLLRALSAAGRHLRRRNWRALTFEHTFTTVSGTLEYALPTSPAFNRLIPNSTYDRTQFRSAAGAYTPAGWQAGEALLVVSGGLQQNFRIKTDSSVTPHVDKFYLLDDPGGAYTIAYEYGTNEWLYDGSSTYGDTITADTQQVLFDDYLYETEVLWRALKLLGEPYFDEKDEAMRVSENLYGLEGGATIAMSPNKTLFQENVPETNIGL